nr:unnamed protein product [Digitaria exilis]
MLQLQPPRFLPLPSRRLAGRRRRARPALALNSKWKLPDVDKDAVRERVRSWMSLARGAIADAAQSARERAMHKEDPESGKKQQRKEVAVEEQALVDVPEVTVDPRVSQGWLSLDAAVSIEQFASPQLKRLSLGFIFIFIRWNGLTGRQVQRIFEALAPEHLHNDARSLVEYSCFRYLSRDDSDFHPNLKGRLVGEDAFVRIAPAVAGVADVSTAHFLFRALVGAEQGLSFDIWTTYLAELLKVHHSRQTHQMGDKALYFEQAIGLSGTKKPLRLDLTNQNSRVEKAKVGPFGSKLFDSAVSVSSGSTSDEWTLEFVDFSGEMRRDELMLPFAIVAEKFKKLQRWENPRSTICFLLLIYTVIFRNMLSYVFPFTLMMMALSMLAVKGLKEQGRLGRSFGKVTIRDQPPSNTIQKILALKEAMASVENYLQNLNVSLLKIRTIFLAGQPEVTTQIALVLLASSAVLLVFPFKYVLAFFTLDLFTSELEFRREMVRAFINFLKERWESIHAAPVVVLPYEGAESNPKTLPAKASGQSESQNVQRGSSYVTSKNGINSS